MPPKEKLLNSIKTIFGDTRQAIVSIIVLALVGGSSGLLYLSKTALDFFLQLLRIPTPLWAAILLVLLCCLYIYLKTHKTNQSLQNLHLKEVKDVGENLKIAKTQTSKRKKWPLVSYKK